MLKKKPKIELRNQFLLEYAKSYAEIEAQHPNEVLRHLCENYRYSPNYNDIVEMARGWMWGKSGDVFEAFGQSVILRAELNDMYKYVAAENNWNLNET